METSLAQKAIQEALAGNWEAALKTNLEIVHKNTNDIDALNRIARAYKELGQITKAKTYAKKVLKIDPVNSIAVRCLEKWKALNESQKTAPTSILSESFLEEPGRTKLVTLMHTGDPAIVSSLESGSEVNLLVHPHRVSVTTSAKKYIGRLPDDLAARIRRLIKAGNKYQALVKTVEGQNEVKIFIRELSANDGPSFPTEKIEYVSFTPPELVHKEGGPIDSLEEEV